MSLGLDAARILFALGCLGEDFVGVDWSELDGEELAASVTSMVANLGAAGAIAAKPIYTRVSAGRIAAQPQYSKWTPQERQQLRNKKIKEGDAKAGNPILWCLSAVQALELTLGFGSPDEGDVLTAGAQQFTTVSEQLNSALPDDGWLGPASQAYANQDKTLQGIADEMAALDRQLAAVIKEQADWVIHIRLGFGILKNLLLAAYAIQLTIAANPFLGGPPAARAFSLAAAALGATAAAGMVSTLITVSAKKGQQVDKLTDQYRALAEGVDPTGASDQTAVGETESAASSVQAIAGGLSGMPGFSGTPSVESLARLAGGRVSPDQWALLSGALDGEAFTDSVAAISDVTMPSALVSAPPTLSQVAQVSSLSGHVAQHLNPANQTTGQVRKIASIAQQGQRSATEQAIEVEGVGAASGTTGAGAAPITWVGADDRGYEPTPLKRSA